MRFLVDENTGHVVARWLMSQGHDVFSVFKEARGLDDDSILSRAFEEDRIVITSDKDFGAMVFHEGKPHKGIILLRLKDESPDNQIRALKPLIETHHQELADHFTVVTKRTVRMIPIRKR